jgi:23S rRNA A1618 N6-methylase RlmF
MALYRSGNSKLIEIKSDEFTLTFVGNEIDTKSVALGYNNDINSTTIIHGNIKENLTIKILNDDKTLYKQSKHKMEKKTVINCLLTLNKLKKGLVF